MTRYQRRRAVRVRHPHESRLHLTGPLRTWPNYCVQGKASAVAVIESLCGGDPMSTTTLVIILVLLLVLGGGWGYSRRGRRL
jgi:hypothetical protein